MVTDKSLRMQQSHASPSAQVRVRKRAGDDERFPEAFLAARERHPGPAEHKIASCER